MNISTAAQQLADETADAYSAERYGRTEWARAIQLLIDRGYNPNEVEAIMRSKWTRWAGDVANRGDDAKAEDLIAFIETRGPNKTFKSARHFRQQLDWLVRDMFEGD